MMNMEGLTLDCHTAMDILEHMQNALIVIDNEGQITFLNHAAEDALKVSADAVVGKALKEMIPHTKLLDVLANGLGYANHKVKIGEGKFSLSTGAAIKRDGRIIGAYAIFQDYQKLQRKLQISEAACQELNAIIESSYDGIWIFDGNGLTLRVNRAYEKFSGIKASEVVGRRIHDLVKEGYYSDSAALHVLETKEPVTLIHEIKTGKKAMVTANPVFDAEGKIYRVIANVRDITLMSNLQEQLENMKHLSKTYELELRELRRKSQDNDIICHSKSMEQALELARRVANVNSTVLILGESGVGKSMIAKFIHVNSKRKNKPFISINCGAIPEQLLESELFGYEKGSFTGAGKDGKAGLLELAQDGTLCLDEISELPLHLQVKMLHAVQEQQFYRVGGTRSIKLDVRILAATNIDLSEMVKQGTFRKDLYYRINVVPILIPSLLNRREDIPLLLSYFLERLNKKFGFKRHISPKVVDLFMVYHWPGNVRELENVLERLVVLSQDDLITVSDLPASIRNQQEGTPEGYNINVPKNGPLKDALEFVEKFLITESLHKGGSTRRAAYLLKVDQSTVVRKAQKYKIGYCINPNDIISLDN